MILLIAILVILLVLILIAVVLFSQMLANRISAPILELSAGAERIGEGDLEHTLKAHTGDEIEELANTFNKMVSDIRVITGEKERIGAELNVATRIQASMLPSIFPAFPDRSEFEIYASMLPAKEVGGDFYDFFLIDEQTLAVVMADVSGKGVPAALFMVIAKTLLKNNAQNGQSPKEVFETVNNLLCENNEAGMFVTVFMGYLDIPSGKFSFVNAGHNPPLIRRKGEAFEWLHTKVGFVLAGMEDMVYVEGETRLNAGDEFYLYTDGVTEAVNNEYELFTDPRLLEVANSYLDLPIKEFTVSVKREIDKFAEGAEQADDITMLMLRYRGV
jgi:sigma-B regulation protein RsbU (phosphoserine phosphatase)